MRRLIEITMTPERWRITYKVTITRNDRPRKYEPTNASMERLNCLNLTYHADMPNAIHDLELFATANKE